ncbi:GNAT family N-acetyltransferase [Ruania alba]|uniref:Protein N-acetyltransferase, RimJ/RimL family n=1 Tax=Ruania alba TaxID=648782 RepID=A0A1H5DTW7_9MICO|nr:GNAT family protein [Ruania alba]SED82297.1 Protein N-acetyltransferase, RimJ/RimL family [Ruania alba]
MDPACTPALTALWPPAGLTVRAGDLELRYLDDELLVDLAELASRGVHAPEAMPFVVPWTRGTPEEIARSVLRYQWQTRASMSPDAWGLELAVLHQGRPVGIQAVGGKDVPTTRVVGTGSWVGREHQGQGIGTRMRALVLHLAFDGFGAQVARTEAWVDNPASNAVSRKLGYRENGLIREAREGTAVEHRAYRLERADWEAHRVAHPKVHPGEVTYQGLDAVREFLHLP